MLRNSLQEKNNNSETLLFILPHEDDEINIAANIILTFVAQGKEIFVLYATNGDFKVSAKIRIKEAINSLKKLGVPEDHVFFLGYGDNQQLDTCVFCSFEETIKSAANHNETYAPEGYLDYAYQLRKTHSKYNYYSFKKDLYDLIYNIRADIVFSVDFDNHIDHRMLSLAFDEIMGKILSLPDFSYHPLVCKSFAYSISYFAEEDYSPFTLKETLFPNKTNVKRNETVLIGKLIYDWDKRVRFPLFVREKYPLFIMKQPIVAALKQYVSQYALFRARRIINSDQLFWIRRTDSISYEAAVSATSGDFRKINDFMLYNARNIDQIKVPFEDYLWKPDSSDKNKILSFSWTTAKTIVSFEIYGNIDRDSTVEKIKITLDNGYYIETGPLPKDGCPLSLLIPVQENIRRCEIQILEYTGENYGISEIEIFSSVRKSQKLSPYVKIMIEDNFIYDYYSEIPYIMLNIYQWNIEGKVIFELISGPGFLNGQRVIMQKKYKPVTVRAYLEDNSEIYDVVKLYWVKNKKLMERAIYCCDSIWMYLERIRCYVINYFQLLCDRGWKDTVCVMLRNIWRKIKYKGEEKE